MNRYLKLVNFEFNRFLKLYFVLIGVTIFTQIFGVIYESGKYLKTANQSIYEELIPKSDFIAQHGTMSLMRITDTLWFLGPIALCAVVLLIYVFFIWYRDWLGKNTFSYRLLMLPTARINVYLAKATTILLFVLGLVAIQLLLFPVESQVLKWMVPNDFRTDFSVYEIINSYQLKILYPTSFIDFLLYYGGGLIGVFIIFTAILFERSFRIKGIIYGIIYVGLSVVFFLLPILLDSFIFKSYFYPIELFFLELITGLIVLAGAIWTGNYLIKNKIMV
jgi:hypothetical protein